MRLKSFVCIGCCIGAVLLLQFARGTAWRALTEEETQRLYGGDEYDDYALCDGTNNCVACEPDDCVLVAGGWCDVTVEGNDGCANASGTDSYCNSFSLWSDCEYKGGVQVCGGPSNRRACYTMDRETLCSGWGVGNNPQGCVAGTQSIEQCQNCATIP